jgi:hypothetical protein
VDYIKPINKSEHSKMLYQCTWLVENTVQFSRLQICEKAQIIAPQGKKVTLIVNGIVKDIKPGLYTGRVILYVSSLYIARPEGLMVFNQIHAPMAAAICLENGRIVPEKSVSAAVWGGAVSDKKAEGIYIGAGAEFINGIIIDNTDYCVENVRMDMEGFGRNDYAGCDSGVLCVGKSNVEIRDSSFNLSGTTRCAIHVSGDSRVTVDNCDIVNISPDIGWIGRFCWSLPLRGSNRLCQLAGNGQVVYRNCRLKTNGWGVLSIDGSDEFVSLYVKDCKLELSGPDTHGYGTFCIGPNEVTIDHSVVDVYGFPMLVMGMEGKGRPRIINGSVIKGRRFGAMCVGDDCSIFDIIDSTFDTEKANIVVKQSSTTINISNCVMKSKDKVLLQLMDTDECGMDVVKFRLPIGEEDKYIDGRDLAAVDPALDVTLNLSNMSVEGDIYNSTTNLRAYLNCERDGMGRFHDTLVGPVEFNGDNNANSDAAVENGGKDQRGPKNLAVNAVNTHITGVISSAVQAYPDGVTELTVDNCLDVSNITQRAAKPVNNGVILHLDKNSIWTVTGESWLTKLVIEEGATVEGIIIVNGVQMPAIADEYIGMIKVKPL